MPEASAIFEEVHAENKALRKQLKEMELRLLFAQEEATHAQQVVARVKKSHEEEMSRVKKSYEEALTLEKRRFQQMKTRLFKEAGHTKLELDGDTGSSSGRADSQLDSASQIASAVFGATGELRMPGHLPDDPGALRPAEEPSGPEPEWDQWIDIVKEICGPACGVADVPGTTKVATGSQIDHPGDQHDSCKGSCSQSDTQRTCGDESSITDFRELAEPRMQRIEPQVVGSSRMAFEESRPSRRQVFSKSV
eukprot:gb/GFBE01064523.1/.p1 GENE.gb/GFBE01064523.1/~~gb/GFBE01064523.1/.p1  ORF type:complete len:251 (+),score=47.89 gb/GFBE01064523.1/:1-753(+)